MRDKELKEASSHKKKAALPSESEVIIREKISRSHEKINAVRIKPIADLKFQLPQAEHELLGLFRTIHLRGHR